ncbi:MAG: V-type ATPase subunit [Planctomycetota bacterium]|jgi:V/A-type H+-transporting ATPase subunit C
MSAWDYGNARIRALRSRLFDRHAYRELLRARNIEALLGALSATAYRPDVEAALARNPDLLRFDEVLRIHGARVMHALPAWYAGEARRGVERLLARWDWRNLRTILQALARRVPAADIEPLLVPAGSLDRAALDALARQDDVVAAVDLMRAWGLPTRGLLGDDPLAALDRLWAPYLDVDRLNLMTALRLRAARLHDRVEAREEFLPGGALDPRLLDDVAHASTREAVRSLLPKPWPRRLAAWERDGDLAALSDALEIEALLDAVRGFVRGDPLGPAIPRAFVAAKELEMRNLRCVARGIEAGRLPAEIEGELTFS